MERINDLKALLKLEKACVTSSVNVSKQVHVVAFNYVNHALNTGDTRPLERFLNALQLRYAAAVAQWGNDFASLFIKKSKDGIYSVKKAAGKPTDMGKLEAVAPMDHMRNGKSKAAADFDFKKSLDLLIAKAKKAKVEAKLITSLSEISAKAA